jgi:hypothetical protein
VVVDVLLGVEVGEDVIAHEGESLAVCHPKWNSGLGSRASQVHSSIAYRANRARPNR